MRQTPKALRPPQASRPPQVERGARRQPKPCGCNQRASTTGSHQDSIRGCCRCFSAASLGISGGSTIECRDPDQHNYCARLACATIPERGPCEFSDIEPNLAQLGQIRPTLPRMSLNAWKTSGHICSQCCPSCSADATKSEPASTDLRPMSAKCRPAGAKAGSISPSVLGPSKSPRITRGDFDGSNALCNTLDQQWRRTRNPSERPWHNRA